MRQGETLATVESNESLQSYAIKAPLAGVITARTANVGEQTGDKPLFVVADLSTVWVELSLFPRDAAKVHVGQSARVKSPDVEFVADGKVTYVAPFGSSTNQTLTARVQLDNTQRRWAPGLYVTAELTLAERDVPLAIRNTAIQILHDVPVVFVQGTAGFEARPVKLGRSDGEITEVLEGLKVGETYAAANSYVLKAEALKSEAARNEGLDMIDALLRFSIARRWIVLFLVAAVGALGVWNYQRLPIDAVPDITNVQVQINARAPGYTPLETESRVTFAIESGMGGIPGPAALSARFPSTAWRR